jgi:hypothetical protein
MDLGGDFLEKGLGAGADLIKFHVAETYFGTARASA